MLCGKSIGYSLILMDTHKIEPVLLLCAWLEKFDFLISEGSEQPFVPDVAHTIQSKFSVSFLHQNRLDLDIV